MICQTPNCGAGVSPVKISHVPDCELESTASEVAFSSTLCDWPLRYDRVSCCWKTSAPLLTGVYPPYSGRWPRAGILQNGIVYLRPPLVPYISEIECSFWPTPDTRGFTNDGAVRKLAALVPTAEWDGMTYRKGRGVKAKLLPTATSRDWKDTPGMSFRRVNPDGSVRSRVDQLPRRVYADSPIPLDGNSGALNPAWVEWFMGFPLEWTVLDA